MILVRWFCSGYCAQLHEDSTVAHLMLAISRAPVFARPGVDAESGGMPPHAQHLHRAWMLAGDKPDTASAALEEVRVVHRR